MATFGEFDLGKAVRVTSMPAPGAIQENHYPGINGVTVLWLGLRGGEFEVSGWFYGPTPKAVTDWFALMITYADGAARVLSDDIGNSYPYVIFEGSPRWQSDFGYSAQLGGVCRKYAASFKVLA